MHGLKLEVVGLVSNRSDGRHLLVLREAKGSLPEHDVSILTRSSKTGTQNIPFDPLYFGTTPNLVKIKNLNWRNLWYVKHRVIEGHDVLQHDSPNDDTFILGTCGHQMERPCGKRSPLNVVDHRFVIHGSHQILSILATLYLILVHQVDVPVYRYHLFELFLGFLIESDQLKQVLIVVSVTSLVFRRLMAAN